MKKYNHVIIDGTNLYWRNASIANKQYFTYKNDKINISGIVGSLNALQKLEKFFLQPNGIIWILFDNPDSATKYRKDIDPDYKSSREQIPEGVQIVGKYLIEILKIYNNYYRLVFAKHLEADDLVLPLVQLLNKSNSDDSILLISSDLDWSRSITKTCDWYNWKKLYTWDMFQLDYGFYPEANKVKLYKALIGDKIDSIPNPFYNKLKKIDWKLERKLLLPLIQQCNDIDDFFRKLYGKQLVLSENWIQRFKLIESRIRLNYQLVDFIIPINFDISKEIIKCEYSKNKLKFWFDIFGIAYEARMKKSVNPKSFFAWEEYKRV